MWNYFNKLTEQHPDLTIRSFRIGGTNIQAACLFMKEMVDEKTINEQILDRLMHNWDEFTTGETEFIQSDEIIDLIKNHVLSFYKIKSIQSYSDIFIHLIRGSTAVLVDGCDQAIVMATSKKLTTSLGPSETEAIVRGPQIGFTNSLEVNLALLRQSLATPNLTYTSLCSRKADTAQSVSRLHPGPRRPGIGQNGGSTHKKRSTSMKYWTPVILSI